MIKNNTYNNLTDVTNLLVKNAVQVDEICSPLKILRIAGFFFMRIYPDGTLLDLATHVPWGEYFFDQLYSEVYKPEEICDHFFLHDKVSLWQHNPQNRIWKDGKDYFSIGSGISIVKNYATYKEVYGFFSSHKANQGSNFYINNIDLLDKFIIYFKKKAELLIKQSEVNRIVIPNKYIITNINQDNNNEITEKFLKKINSTNLKYELTTSEARVLRWLCLGKSSEEIGIILNCSKRTIETHVNNMKLKLDCSKITKLIYRAASEALVEI